MSNTPRTTPPNLYVAASTGYEALRLAKTVLDRVGEQTTDAALAREAAEAARTVAWAMREIDAVLCDPGERQRSEWADEVEGAIG